MVAATHIFLVFTEQKLLSWTVHVQVKGVDTKKQCTFPNEQMGLLNPKELVQQGDKTWTWRLISCILAITGALYPVQAIECAL